MNVFSASDNKTFAIFDTKTYSIRKRKQKIKTLDTACQVDCQFQCSCAGCAGSICDCSFSGYVSQPVMLSSAKDLKTIFDLIIKSKPTFVGEDKFRKQILILYHKQRKVNSFTHPAVMEVVLRLHRSIMQSIEDWIIITMVSKVSSEEASNV